jgi:hypothetical protein
VELASATHSKRGALAAGASIPSRRGPWLALAGGLLLLAVGAGLIAAHVTVFALDETLIEQSAVHYTSGLPHTLVHDLDARATNRLYPLVLSISLRVFDGAQALRIDHILSVLMFLSAAVPIFLMARVLLRSNWYAVAAALLSVAVPWLTLTTALFTENLSYPLFWWMILATAAAIWRPSAGRDALALVTIALLVGTRVQFAAVYVGYLMAVLLRSLQLAGGRHTRPLDRIRTATTNVVRGYPLSTLLLVGIFALVVYEKSRGQLRTHVTALLGSYSNVVTRNGLPANMGEGLSVELIALALGVGLLPAIVSIAWFVRRMARPMSDRRWVYVAASAIVMAVFMILTVYSQGGYLGPITEERYFFYVVPAFWLGTLAALEDGDVRPGDLLLGALGLALLYASIPFLSSLNQETAFLRPAESIVPYLLSGRFAEVGLSGLSMQDALALFALVCGVVTAWLWARGRVIRLWWTVGVAAVVQLSLVGYAFAVIDGKASGIAGRTAGSVSALGWVDAHANGNQVAWLDNLSTSAPPATPASLSGDQLRTTLFWNSSVRSWVRLPQLGLPPVEVPMGALPGVEVASVNAITGMLTPTAAGAGLKDVVGATNSPFLQLEGAPLAHSPDGVLTLTQLAHPVRAVWVAQGLLPEGGVPTTGRARIEAIANAHPATATTRTGLVVTLTFSPSAPPAGAVTGPRTQLVVRLGKAKAHVVLTAGSLPVRVRLTTCPASTSASIGGTITALSPASPAGTAAGSLQSVSVRHGDCRSVRQNRLPSR